MQTENIPNVYSKSELKPYTQNKACKGFYRFVELLIASSKHLCVRGLNVTELREWKIGNSHLKTLVSLFSLWLAHVMMKYRWLQTKSIICRFFVNSRFGASPQWSRRNKEFEVYTNFLPNFKSYVLWFFGQATCSVLCPFYLWRLVQFHCQTSLTVIQISGFHVMSIS